MISISLIIIAVGLLVLRQFGIIKNPMTLFVIGAIIIVGAAFALKDKLSCPFAQKCPFTICPLNKSK